MCTYFHYCSRWHKSVVSDAGWESPQFDIQLMVSVTRESSRLRHLCWLPRSCAMPEIILLSVMKSLKSLDLVQVTAYCEHILLLSIYRFTWHRGEG